MTRNPELPKRRIVARIDVQADSWKDLHWAIAEARERAMESSEEFFLSGGGGGCSFGFRIDVNINESQTAESYQRELSAWINSDKEPKP